MKRRYAALLGEDFLGHAIARIDGMSTTKTPREETFPGRPDREAALLSRLARHGPAAGSAWNLSQHPSSHAASAEQATWQADGPGGGGRRPSED